MRLIEDQSVTGRHVVQEHRDPVMTFLRVLLAIVVGGGFAFLVLYAIFGAPPAHAAQPTIEQQKRAFVQMNDQCRSGGAGGEWACAVRDNLALELQAEQICYQPKATTPAAQWARCTPADIQPAPKWAAQPEDIRRVICSLFGTAAMRAAQDRDVGMPLSESVYKTSWVVNPTAQNLGIGGFVLIHSIPDMTREIYASKATPEQAAYRFRALCGKLSGL